MPPPKFFKRGFNANKRSQKAPEGQTPDVHLRVQVVGCKDLIASDSNGFSDPFVTVTLLGTRNRTPAIKRTLSPTYPPEQATFNFPIYKSLSKQLGALEVVVWDKDTLKDDYLGEADVPLEHWFDGRALGWDEPGNEPFDVKLVSTRQKLNVTGTVQLKLGFVSPENSDVSFKNIYEQLVKRSKHSVNSVPPTEGVGTVRSGGGLEDDGGLSSDSDTISTSGYSTYDSDDDSPAPIPPSIDLTPATPELSRPPTERNASDSLLKLSETAKKTKKKRPPTQHHASGPRLTTEDAHDILGIVLLEIQSASDLPRLANMTRTGWDMDPFVITSFGKKVFRTRVIRHSRNPVWNEKLMFHVRRYEQGFSCQLTVLDWDKFSGNDYIGEVDFQIGELIQRADQPDERGLYPDNGKDSNNLGDGMKEFELALKVKGSSSSLPGVKPPTIRFRAKYQPYASLRQHFWRHYLRQYDADNTQTFSRVELQSMLDSLGSTLTRTTLDGFFARFGLDPSTGELDFDQAVLCLEAEIVKPYAEKRNVNEERDTSVSATPIISAADAKGRPLSLDQLNFSGPPNVGEVPSSSKAGDAHETEKTQEKLDDVAGTPSTSTTLTEDSSSSSSDIEGHRKTIRPPSSSSKARSSAERLINVQNCPLCHRPRLSSKSEVDIVTHLAVCASQDWNRVDRIVVGNFVTASQAQRKWYTKVLGKIGSGEYKLGANSANIIVQNRMTGQLEEEKMQVYVRLGIRLLYKGAKSQMEGARARNLLKSLSIKQGEKYDNPESAKDIPAFIDFHHLNTDEILDPLDSFKNFNEFFYRKLKPTARPVESPEDPYRAVSAADCRLMCFSTVNEATKIWIKGRDFSVAKLLGKEYASEAGKYDGGGLVIFRLAPQDYHRFHSPVEGKVGKMSYIEGEYYTVNPQAIRTALDVYGDNVRKIVPIDSPQFGRVMCVCIGAMMVGSIATTVEEGQHIQRGQEFGYFAFGGSTIVTLFEKGTVEWDEDLLLNGRAALETLVRVGMGIGKGTRRD